MCTCSLIVVKPDTNMFNTLVHKLFSQSSFSHDGADQGFLVAQFDIEASPMFHAAHLPPDDTPHEHTAMRLPSNAHCTPSITTNASRVHVCVYVCMCVCVLCV